MEEATQVAIDVTQKANEAAKVAAEATKRAKLTEKQSLLLAVEINSLKKILNNVVSRLPSN